MGRKIKGKKRRDEEKRANQESQLLKKMKREEKKRQKAKKGQIWYPGIPLYLAYVPLRSWRGGNFFMGGILYSWILYVAWKTPLSKAGMEKSRRSQDVT
jgi:hypothetical protein